SSLHHTHRHLHSFPTRRSSDLTTPEHAELKEIAKNCVTRHHAHHYLGFAETQWKLFQKETPPHVKPLLYVYRVLLTGIHLMWTRSEEHTSELQSPDHLVCRLLL